MADGYHLWSERYDREMDDVFEVQDEISRSIAEALKVRLAGGTEGGALVAPPTRDVVAYDRYLKGRYLWNQRRVAEAITELEAAIDQDPAMVEGHTALADAWAVWGFYGGVPTWEAWARARAAADQAAELAPDAASVAVSYGILEHYYGWNPAREERFCRLAIERAPKLVDGYFWLSLCLAAVGQFDESARVARRGLEVDPHSANLQTALGWRFLLERQFEAAEQGARSRRGARRLRVVRLLDPRLRAAAARTIRRGIRGLRQGHRGDRRAPQLLRGRQGSGARARGSERRSP